MDYGQKIENTAEEKGRLAIADTAVKDAEKLVAANRTSKLEFDEEAAAKIAEFENLEKETKRAAEEEKGKKLAAAAAIATQKDIIREEIERRKDPYLGIADSEASRAREQEARRQAESLEAAEERRAATAEEQLQTERAALDQARRAHASDVKERSKQTRLLGDLLEQRKGEQKELKDQLNPQRLYAASLGEDLKRPFTRLTFNTDGVKHAMHGLDKYAGQSSTERLLHKLTSTVEKQGEAMTGAVKSLEGEVDSNYNEQVHGNTQDDSPKSGGHAH